jgi:signal transduction histidine kinase
VKQSHFTPEQTQRQIQLLQRYRQIIELSRDLNAVLELPRLLDTIVEAAREVTESGASSLLLIDLKSGDLYFEAATGSRKEEIQRYVVPMEKSIAGWVVQNGEPVLIDDAQKDERHFQQSDIETAFTTRSLLAVPLVVKGRVIGAVEVLNKLDGRSFDQDDADLLAMLANQAAVAIENARLFQQSDLISEMVHELRTPLTAILAYADMLLGDALGNEQRSECLETVRSEAERLTDMINDFLDLARLSSGRAKLVRSNVDMAEVVQAAVRVVQPQADDKGISLSVEAPDAVPPVLGDQQRLYQVALNLLSNAVKYNVPDGSVRVTVDLVEPGHVRVTVRDTGHGISEENQKRLFEKFFRVADAEGYAQGTGLGLSITKQIIEVHGGHIKVESELGVGSTFSFVLPLLDATSPKGS